MKLVLDATSISSGGGVQQCISQLEAFDNQDKEVVFLCTQNFPLFLLPSLRFMEVRVLPFRNRFLIFIFQIWLSRYYKLISDADVVYTFFGIGLRTRKNTKAIVNIAYPIICYYESAFWYYLGFRKRLLTYFKSYTRSFFIKLHSDTILCESEVMRDRLIDTLGVRAEMVHILPPALNLVASQGSSRSLPDRSLTDLKFLYPTGLDPHKNVVRLYDLFRRYSSFSKPFKVYITCTRSEFLTYLRKLRPIDKSILDSYFVFCGKLFGDDLVDMYRRVNCVINVSDLESVSNNFIESKSFELPMLISARDFSLSCVRTPFVICEPHCTASLKDAFESFLAGYLLEPRCSDKLLAISPHDRVSRLLGLISSDK
ncbi:MAG: glycosyltransferase family 4 protein [Oceanospirillaceae bacterium]|nr:glycosyltransferase family 4 protein [Oceanospirillaceae bacterium]